MQNRSLILGLAAGALALVVLGIFVGVPLLERRLSDDFGRGDYTLSATDGTAFTEDTLRGSPSAVFFGYTHCPDVCPTTLGDVATWEEELSAEGKSLRVYFVTVDPERDTAEFLKDYVSWVPEVRGVTGSRVEIDKAIKAFRIYAQKGPVDADGDYFMDHSALILLFDAEGRMFEPIGYQEDHDRVMAKLRRLLG